VNACVISGAALAELRVVPADAVGTAAAPIITALAAAAIAIFIHAILGAFFPAGIQRFRCSCSA